MKKFKFKRKIKLIKSTNLTLKNIKNNTLNLIDVELNFKSSLKDISIESNSYIKNCFDIAFNIIKTGLTNKFLNGPISKKKIFKQKISWYD